MAAAIIWLLVAIIGLVVLVIAFLALLGVIFGVTIVSGGKLRAAAGNIGRRRRGTADHVD